MGFVKKLIKYSTFGLVDLEGDDSPAPPPDPLAAERAAKEEAKKKQKAHKDLVDKYGRSSTFKTGSAGLVTDPNLNKNKLLGGN